MPPKRKSVAERNAAAIAKEATEQAAQVQPPTIAAEAAPTPAPERALISDEAKVKRQSRNALDERVNLGIYLTTETYDAMKSAYLADWTNRRGDADTLYRWVTDALEAHAARSVDERSKLALNRERGETRRGNTRAFKLPADTYQRMQAAIGADEQAGRWISESPWSVDALTAAIEEARAANDGTLPTPPARLPNRLKRRD